jgi:hypothetical protein
MAEPALLGLPALRDIADGSWDEVARWLAHKPGVFTLPHPEQQILFEYADRLRRAIRTAIGNPSWDRLYFDATTITYERALLPLEGRRAPLHVDTRQLFGLAPHAPREATSPDLAISILVLRSTPEYVETDEDGRPRKQSWTPASLRAQGWLLEEHVRHLEALSASACDGFLFVAYSNDARRRTPVELREVASWASWHCPHETFWWTSRHFRARERA